MFTTEDVKINTVQIEIKSLTVGRKQLTLSLMRQIIEEDLIDEGTLQFKGVPWGHVNYFWGDNKDLKYPEYINLIWQKGRELKRCVIQSHVEFREHDLHHAYSELEDTEKGLSDIANGRTYWGGKTDTRKNYLAKELVRWQEHIMDLIYKRDVYIPAYNELLKPLHRLEHFYIAV